MAAKTLEDTDARASAEQDEVQVPAYDPAVIEKRWQRTWRDADLFLTPRLRQIPRGKPHT